MLAVRPSHANVSRTPVTGAVWWMMRYSNNNLDIYVECLKDVLYTNVFDALDILDVFTSR